MNRKHDNHRYAKLGTSEQHRRFVETARELEADESPDAMDRAFERVVGKPKPKGEPRPASRPKRR